MARPYHKKVTIVKETPIEVEVLDEESSKKYTNDKGRAKTFFRVGRPSKLTYNIILEIQECLKDGCYIETAMNFVGIPKERFYEWNKIAIAELKQRDIAFDTKSKRKDEQEIYVQFHNAIRKSLAESERSDLAIISRVADSGNWQAAAWRLERKHPERYGLNNLRENQQDNVREPLKIEILIDDQTDENRIKALEDGIVNEINHR